MRALFSALALTAAFAAQGQEAEPDPVEAPAEELPAQPHRTARARHDGGIGSAFMEGFKEGLEKAQQDAAAQNDGSAAPAEPQISDDQAFAVGLMSMCCCLLGLVGLVVLVVVLVKRSGQKGPAPVGQYAPSQTWSQPPGPAPAPTSAGTAHLSVLAVALDARARPKLESALRDAGMTDSPLNQAQRSTLVRALCGALLDSKDHWRAFGYGDKADFADDRAAEASFRAAWTDFKGRCGSPGEAQGEWVVAVLVLCSRGAVLGTNRLDDFEQARALVQHRVGLAPEAMLAADCFFAPVFADTGALSQEEAFRRFPEMQPLVRLPGA